MTEQKMASWWTPTGWLTDHEPAAFADYYDGWTGQDDPDLASFGYTYLLRETPEDLVALERQIEVRECKPYHGRPEHLLVYVSFGEDGYKRFFVKAEHIVPFCVDKLPAMQEQARRLNEISVAKAFIAWVRHGHGERTIDRSGEEDREDADLQRRLDQVAPRA